MTRLFIWLFAKIAGKEAKQMLVRLYAIEIIDGRTTLEQVPAGLRQRVKDYLVMIGYLEE